MACKYMWNMSDNNGNIQVLREIWRADRNLIKSRKSMVIQRFMETSIYTKRTKASNLGPIYHFVSTIYFFARDTKSLFRFFVGSVFQRATSNNYDMIPFAEWNAD